MLKLLNKSTVNAVSSYLWAQAGSEGHASGGRAAHGGVAHGRADDGVRRGQAIDGWAEGADGRVQLTRAGVHGGRAEQGRVERMVTEASVTHGGAQRRRWELTRGVCRTAREKKELTHTGNFRNILLCEVNNGIVFLFGLFTEPLNGWLVWKKV